MCFFKVENKRIGRKRTLVMHKMSCWKQKVFFSFNKLTWILICTPHLQHGHRLLPCAKPKAKEGFVWTAELPGLRVWGWPHSEHLPSAPSDHWCSPKAWIAPSGLELCLCSTSLQVWALCGKQRPSPGSKCRGWRLHVSWSHAAANHLIQYLADRSISSRDRKVL